MFVSVLRSSYTFPAVKPAFHAFGILLLLTCLFLPAASGIRAGDIQNVDAVSESQLMKAGDKAFRRADYAIAEASFRKVLDINKFNIKAKLRLSHTLLKTRQLIEAYVLAYEVGKADQRNGYAYALVGNILLAAGHFKEAEETLNSAFAIDDSSAFAVAGLGMLDFYNNRLEDSRAKLAWAAYEDYNEPDYLLSLAQVCARLERYREAAEYYRKFLRISPPADMDRLERIRGLVRFLEVLSTRTKLYDTGGKDDTSVPIELINDRPVVKVKIGGSNEVLRFVIDTGSNITVVSQQTADRLGIKPVARGGNARGVGGNGKFEIIYGLLPSLALGDVKIRSVPVYLRRFPDEKNTFDGYIGLSFLSKFLTTIDFENMTFIMSKRNGEEAQRFQAKNEDEFVSTLRLTPSGFLSGEVTLPGVEDPLNFIVDTGAELSVISTELAGRDQVRQFEGKQKMRVIGAAGVTEGVPLFHLPSISFGKHSIEDVRAIALNLSVINENAGFEQSGILGGNFLKHYRLTFDFQHYTLSFSPIKRAVTAKE
jgi:tetratricopeptide (TPR) repeat protein/predicted aspartyl protease